MVRFTDPDSHCHVGEAIKNKRAVACSSVAHRGRETVLSRGQRFWSWLLPPRRTYLVPWGGLEVAAIVLMTHLFWVILVETVLDQTGFFARMYGADFPGHLKESAESVDKALAQDRLLLWLSVFCFPFNVATTLVLPRLLSNTQPYQLGLTTHRLGRNVLAGILGWLTLTPLVLGLNLLVGLLYQWVAQGMPKPHALMELSHADPFWHERVLVVLSAVVAAPIWEELLYRGLLQRWFAARSWGGLLACCLAMVLALANHYPVIKTAYIEHNWRGLGVALQPAGFVLLVSPGLALMDRCRRRQAAHAIYGTALLFAIRHSPSWPDPVAIFVLGLGLGWLADRTRSLVGPIVLHSLFNGVACVMMIWF
jgi:membrane protease YdiL (CAAX protease family)